MPPFQGAIKKGQSRETGNIGHTRHNTNTTQYMLDTTIPKQTQITLTRHEKLGFIQEV
jgi:hypothetical protein